jgi:hypothetical protein
MTTEVTPRAATNAGGLDAKDGLEHGEQRKHPDDGAHDVHEDRRLGHARRIERALEAMHHDTLHEQRDANDNGEKDNLPYERRRVDIRENVLHHASRWPNGSWEAMILSRMRQRDSPFVSSSAASGMASGAKRLDVRPLFMASTSAFPPDGTTLSALWHGLVPQ